MEVQLVKEQEIRRFYNIGVEAYMNSHPPIEDNFDISLFIRMLPSQNQRVLDLGCGYGAQAHFFNPAYYVGLDIAEQMLESGKKLFPQIPFVNAAATKLPFANGKFGGVLAACVLSHLDRVEIKGAVAEINRVLVHSGTALFVMTEGKGTFRSISRYNNQPYKVTCCGTEEMVRLLDSCGLEVPRILSYGSCGLFSVFARKR